MPEESNNEKVDFNPVEKNFYINFIVTEQNKILSKNDELKKMVESAIKRSDAHVVKEIDYHFPVQGWSYASILSESHAASHISPEYNFGSLTISTCGDTNPFKAVRMIIEIIDPIAGFIKYFKAGMDKKGTQNVFPDHIDNLVSRYKNQFETLLQTYKILGRQLEKEDFNFVYCKKGAPKEITDYLAAEFELDYYMDIAFGKNSSRYFT
jgi:S-adenosylmethionine/arginine decarboxylase-like enzyme